MYFDVRQEKPQSHVDNRQRIQEEAQIEDGWEKKHRLPFPCFMGATNFKIQKAEKEKKTFYQ